MNALLDFQLPVRGSNADHLNIFTTAAETYGTGVAERVASTMRMAKRFGLEGATVGDWLKKMRVLGLAADAAGIANLAGRRGVRQSATVDQYFVAVVRGDLEDACDDLRRRGYRDNQVARFRVRAWRAFKLALRRATQMRSH